jgi:hypothetical protein
MNIYATCGVLSLLEFHVTLLGSGALPVIQLRYLRPANVILTFRVSTSYLPMAICQHRKVICVEGRPPAADPEEDALADPSVLTPHLLVVSVGNPMAVLGVARFGG